MDEPTKEEIAAYIGKTIAERMEASFIGRSITQNAIAAVEATVAGILNDIKQMGYPVPSFRVTQDPDDPSRLWIEDEDSYRKRTGLK